MKKIILFIVLMFVTLVKVEALSVEKNEITIKSGESSTISLSADVGESQINSIEFTLIYMSNDVKSNFKGANDTINGTKHKIVLTEPTSGMVNLGNVIINVVNSPTVKTGEIKLHSAKAITIEEEEIMLNPQTITVTVDNSANENVTKPNEPEEPVSNTNVTTDSDTTTNNNTTTDKKEEPTVTTVDKKENPSKEEANEQEETKETILKSIESDIVSIKLKDNKFEYTVKIDETVEELDLKPILNDESYQVEVSNQKISELEDNTITITISKDDFKETYTINVKIAEEIEIDNQKFISSSNHKGKWTTIIIILSVVLVVGLLFVKKKR